MSPIVAKFCEYYRELTLESLNDLATIYSHDAMFIDPVHSTEGLANISRYFERLVGNINHCRFYIDEVVEAQQQAFVTWVMDFSHPKLNRGKAIQLHGSSHLQFTDRIVYHRDYYDLGQMVYEQVPLLNTLIKQVKSRMSA